MVARFTTAEKSNEATRESGRRRRVSSKLIDEGKMTATDADRLVGIMEEIASDYEFAHKRDGAKADKLAVAKHYLQRIIDTSKEVGVAYELAAEAMRKLSEMKP